VRDTLLAVKCKDYRSKYQFATAPATTNFSQANIRDIIHNIPTM